MITGNNSSCYKIFLLKVVETIFGKTVTLKQSELLEVSQIPMETLLTQTHFNPLQKQKGFTSLIPFKIVDIESMTT